jgi:Na+/H+ antiporter NhaD/arsenite permease-like protein
MSLSLWVLIAVFLGIALRQLFRIPLKIWEMMALGAGAVVLAGQITPLMAWQAVEWDVILFLFGMFVVGQALEESGAFEQMMRKLKLDQCSLALLGFTVVFGAGLLSVILMNDTIAIIGTPLLAAIARQRGVSLEKLLLLLAFAVTTASVMSPIGNPQNLFIALKSEMSAPFTTFFSYLALPTLLNLLLLYLLFFYFMEKETHPPLPKELPPSKSTPLAYLSLTLIFLMIGWNIASAHPVPLPWIALIPAALILIFSPERKRILTRIDWHTLGFFIAMFVLMASVWQTSALKEALPPFTGLFDLMWIALFVSQLISNVPMVALYMPLIGEQSTASYMALAAGSTIAGNFLILGAASNIIIIQNAEKRGEKAFTFFQFAKIGIPFSLLNIIIYWIYFRFIE